MAEVAGEAILSVQDLIKHFPVRIGVLFKRTIGQVRAVDGVSFDLLLVVLVLRLLTVRLRTTVGSTDLDELRELHD